MIEEIFRKYLEIKSINDLNEVQRPSNDYSLNLIELKDFQLNKFFYKEIGKKCYWVDRLAWTDQNWIEYVVPALIGALMELLDNPPMGEPSGVP